MRRTAVALGAALGLATGSAALYAADSPLRGWVAPASENVHVSTAGYRFSVHPAFSHRAVVRDARGRETELYRQQGAFMLPDGRMEPPQQHVIELRGGAAARDLGITVNDPKHQVARITVELYDASHQPGRGSPVTETLVVDNDANTCPPVCVGPPPE